MHTSRNQWRDGSLNNIHAIEDCVSSLRFFEEDKAQSESYDRIKNQNKKDNFDLFTPKKASRKSLDTRAQTYRQKINIVSTVPRDQI